MRLTRSWRNEEAVHQEKIAEAVGRMSGRGMHIIVQKRLSLRTSKSGKIGGIRKGPFDLVRL